MPARADTPDVGSGRCSITEDHDRDPRSIAESGEARVFDRGSAVYEKYVSDPSFEKRLQFRIAETRIAAIVDVLHSRPAIAEDAHDERRSGADRSPRYRDALGVVRKPTLLL